MNFYLSIKKTKIEKKAFHTHFNIKSGYLAVLQQNDAAAVGNIINNFLSHYRHKNFKSYRPTNQKNKRFLIKKSN